MQRRFVAVSSTPDTAACFLFSLFPFVSPLLFCDSFYGQWVNRRIEIPFTVIAIFFAVRLNKAKLPEWVDWILVAYVVFHILTHLVLTVSMIV